MKPTLWPFCPDHISNDSSELLGVGIIRNDYLQGLQTAISNNLRNPTAILEFPPDDNKPPVRTDSKSIHFDLHPQCRIFREHTDAKFCKDCDNCYAMLFRGLRRSNVVAEIENRAARVPLIMKQRAIPDDHFKFNSDDKNRPYLEYDCSLLGYREVIFPIFFEDRVIAVFFVGEIILSSKLQFIPKTQEAFFREHPDCATLCQKQIREAHDKWVGENAHILDDTHDTSYDTLIEKAKQDLNGLDQQLEREMRLQRDSYVQTKVLDLTREFRQDPSFRIPSEGQDWDMRWRREDALEPLWSSVERFFGKAVKEMALGYVIVFGRKSISARTGNILSQVVTAGTVPPGIRSSAKPTHFDLGKLPMELRESPATSYDCPVLFDGLLDCEVDRQKMFLRIVPGFFSQQGTIVILVGYDSSKWDPLVESDHHSQATLARALDSFYSVLTSSLSSILALAAQTHTKDTLRLFGHEADQLTVGLDALRQRYLSDVQKLRNLDESKANDLVQDITGYLRQLHFLFSGANMLISEVPVPEKTSFWAFKELIFKWKDTYRTDSEVKKLQFDIHHPHASDATRPRVWGDLRLLEQLLYNLVNNAVKYCHRGTKIRIDCQKRDNNPASPHILTVTDYGREIENTRKPYDLYYRGDNVRNEAGLGIGLYNALRIATAHGGSIRHEPTQVSAYNVPLIEKYISMDLSGKDEELTQALRAEIRRLKQAGILNDILALTEDGGLRYANPSENEVEKAIRAPTWQVSFYVEIPSKEAII